MISFSHSKSVLRTAFALTASFGAICTATTAQAQAAQNSNEEGAGREIVVTAQFREQKLQDTPLSITAVDAELLEARNQTDLGQIAAQAPNVTLNSMGGAYGSSLGASIRGIGQFDFNPAYEPGVGMYIDDVYYATLTGGIFDLLDLERVEVLRGPQGTLTGRNSIGGAIKLHSKKPSDENTVSVEAAYGSRNRIDGRASINFVLGEGLYARLSAVHKRQDGYVDQIDYGCKFPGNALGITATGLAGSNCVIDKFGEKNYTGVRGAIRYNPSDNFDLVLSGDYTKENRTNAAEVVSSTIGTSWSVADPSYLCGKFCNYASFTAPAGGQATARYSMPNNTKFEGYGFSANMTLGLSDSLNLKSITAYRHYDTQWGTDDDYTPSNTNVGQGFNDLSFKFFSQELRLNGQIGDNVEFTVGGYYSDQKSLYATRQDIRYLEPLYNFLNAVVLNGAFNGLQPFYLQFDGNDPVNADSQALFGTVIARPSENLTLTGGLRYTKEHKDYTFSRRSWGGGPLTGFTAVQLGSLDGVTANYDGKRTDWRISADYRFSPQVLGYISVGTGFKGGGVTARPFDAAQALNGSYDPETVLAYEIGLKTDLLDRRLRINSAIFLNKYNNQQLPLSTCVSLGSNAPCGARQNAGDGTINGVEIEMQATPVDGLDIDGSISYLGGSWTKIDPRVGNAYLLSDPIVPTKWKWSFGIQYKADLGGSGSLTPRFDVTNTGSSSVGRTGGGAPIDYNPAVTLANARLTWRNPSDDMSVSLEVQNVFDKYYTPFRFAAVQAFSGTIYSQVGRPREWAVSVKKSF